MVSWIKHSVDRFVIVSIFIPKLRLILILNSFLGSSDSLVFSELFHSLAPRPLAARSISDFLLTRSEERFSRNAETDLVCRLLLEIVLIHFYPLSLHDALPILVSWIKHSVDRFVIVSIFIPKLRLILILNSFLGSSDSLVFSELFHSLAPRPLAARSISDFLLTYLAT